MKLGSLFDGAGTCPHAGSMCGITPAWASEIEPFPRAVSSSNFPKMKHLGDICGIKGFEIEPVDIITFGSPCQDLSIAGRREGLDGKRSGLFLEAVRIIKEMRGATNGRYPQIAIWENVIGAFSSNGGEDFRTVLQEMCRIEDPFVYVPGPPKRGGRGRWTTSGEIMGPGYSVAWRVLDAKLWGVPQRRRRVFLVADFGGQCAGEVCFERPGLSRNFTEDGRKRKALGPVAESSSGAASRDVPYTLKVRSGCNGGGKGALMQTDLSATLSCNGGEQTLFQPKPYVVENHPQDSRVKLNRDGIVQTLPSNMGTGGKTPQLYYRQPVFGELIHDDSASTLLAHNAKQFTDIILSGRRNLD